MALGIHADKYYLNVVAGIYYKSTFFALKIDWSVEIFKVLLTFGIPRHIATNYVTTLMFKFKGIFRFGRLSPELLDFFNEMRYVHRMI